MTPETHGFQYYVIYWLVSAIAVLITSKMVKGFIIKGFGSAILAAIVIALVNTFIWPVLFILTLPINILTLGLFTLVVNGMAMKIAAAFLSGFDIDGWWPAIIGALVLWVVNWGLHYLLV